MATSQAIELRRVAIVKVILENLAQGKTISESCQIAGISPRTFRKWRKSGALDEYLADMLQEIKVSGLSQIADAWPGAVAQLCEDVQGTALSARDRDQRFRSLLQVIKTMFPDLSEPEATGELAKDWLRKHGKKFPPLTAVQVNVAGDLVVGDIEDDVVEGTATELKRGPGPHQYSGKELAHLVEPHQEDNAAIEEPEPEPEVEQPTPCNSEIDSEELERLSYPRHRREDSDDEHHHSEVIFAGRKSV